MLAAIDSFGYRLVFVIHIGTIAIAFGGAVLLPVFDSRARRAETSDQLFVTRVSIHAARYVIQPALWVAMLAGTVLIVLSDDQFEMSDLWISFAWVLWIVAVVSVLIVGQANRRRAVVVEQLSRGDEAASPAELRKLEQRVAAFGGLTHLAFVLLLVDMVWKPGT